ncbi:hypothetical protein [Actinomadura sp. K4S16]|uniref:hypothetical protein n=1 Tax=Actinomadura sp. K4S16 TaxID=1316147 RepID=UPI0011EDDD9D|nr:hypothetical protein [Actinomadura sp. K4S16]
MNTEEGYWTPEPDPPKQAQLEQGTAPTGDDGEEALADDIAQFTSIEQSGPWMLAYLVARRVLPGEGDGVGFEQESTKCFGRNTFLRISAREFAKRADTSAKRVMALWRAWNRLAEATDGLFPHALDLQPGEQTELPDLKKYPFYGKDGYYRGWETRNMSAERRENIEREAEASGIRPSAITYVITHPSAVKNALLADETTRAAARDALAEFDARQASADAADREAADAVAAQRTGEFDAHRSERESIAAAARAARNGNQADASMEVFNAIGEIKMAAARALARLSKQHINFTPERAEAIAELCDGVETAIAAVRDLATGAALDDAALAAFLDDSGGLR